MSFLTLICMTHIYNILNFKPDLFLLSIWWASWLKMTLQYFEGSVWKQQTLYLKTFLSTRPTLDSPPPPTLTHVPGESVLANLPTDMPSPVVSSPSPTIIREIPASLNLAGNSSPAAAGSTILKIPKVHSSNLLSPTNSILSPESLELTKANANNRGKI